MTDRTAPADADRLRRIIELCESISDAIGGISLESFVGDDVLRDAVAYRLAAIGEECKKLSDEVRAEHDLPWRHIMGMRDRLAHDYFGSASEIIFVTATSDLAPLLRACAKSLKMRTSPRRT